MKIDINKSTAKEVGDHVRKVAGIDIFDNTRKREYVEYRALLCYLLREKLGMRWVYIASYFEEEGRPMHHATVMHLVKMYPRYKLNNKNLELLEKRFNFKSTLKYDEIDKMHYLQNKYINFENKYKDLKAEMGLPIVELLRGIPKERYGEVERRIKILKQSWKWQRKNK